MISHIPDTYEIWKGWLDTIHVVVEALLLPLGGALVFAVRKVGGIFDSRIQHYVVREAPKLIAPMVATAVESGVKTMLEEREPRLRVMMQDSMGLVLNHVASIRATGEQTNENLEKLTTSVEELRTDHHRIDKVVGVLEERSRHGYGGQMRFGVGD